MNSSLNTLKKRNPAAAAQIADMLGTGLHLLWSLNEIDIDSVDILLDASKLLSYFSDTPEEYLAYQSNKDAADAYDSACGWLTAHKVPERFQLFESLVHFICQMEQANKGAVPFYLKHYADDSSNELLPLAFDLGTPLNIDTATVSHLISQTRRQIKSGTF